LARLTFTLLAALLLGSCGGTDPAPLDLTQHPPTGQPGDTVPAPPAPSPTPTPSPSPSPGDLAGGVLATFRMTGTGSDGQSFDETFRVWVTNPTAIGDLFALQAGTSTRSMPNGKLLTGPGRGDHNLPWSWHLDPNDIQLGDIAIEACDGRPSIVEAFLAGYLAVGRFCPSGATLESLDDFR